MLSDISVVLQVKNTDCWYEMSVFVLGREGEVWGETNRFRFSKILVMRACRPTNSRYGIGGMPLARDEELGMSKT